MKEIVEENILKQAERIFEHMKFSNKEQEATIRKLVIANLARSVKASQRSGHAVFDARESRLYKFINALRRSKDQTEFFKNLHVEFPKFTDVFLANMIHKYQRELAGTIVYPFALDTTIYEKKKVSQPSGQTLEDVVNELRHKIFSVSEQLKQTRKEVEELQMLIIKHKHNAEGKSYLEQIIM